MSIVDVDDFVKRLKYSFMGVWTVGLITMASANMPARNQNGYFFGTESQIYLNPSCKFKFVCCIEIYLKKYQV